MKEGQIKLSPDTWRNSYKWQFEAYPFFCSVYQKVADTPGNHYHNSWNFLSHFSDGHLIAFEPKFTLNLKGEMAIEELIGGKDDFLVLFEEVHEKISKSINHCLQIREQGRFMELEIWWPEFQKTLSEVSSVLFPFDFTLSDKMKEWQEKDDQIFKVLNESIRSDGDSFFDEATAEAMRIKNKFHDPQKIHREFIKKLGWIQNSYAGMKNLTSKWIDDFIDGAKCGSDKQRVVESVTGKYKLLIEVSSRGIMFRDDKKKLFLIGVELMEKWLRGICRRNDWQFEELRWLSMDEVLLLIKGEKKYLALAKKYAQQNKRIGLMNEIGYSDISEEFFEKVTALQLEGVDSREIKGLSGNKGNYRGIARIVTDIKRDGESLEIGDVLITSMTRPEYLPLMKRAGAFVTDEGGITCHAAIIAREMKKPCIIGTKIATQVLKDGDLVEVDADKGIVRIIEKVK